MKNDKVFKNKFVEKLSSTYGFEPLHARLIYDLMVESFVEAWDGGTDLYIPRIGEFGFRVGKGHGGNFFRSRRPYFRPAKEVLYRATGKDYQIYLDQMKKAREAKNES